MRTSEMKRNVAKMQGILDVVESLHNAGVPYNQLEEHVYIPFVQSGYSMGESMKLYVKDNLIWIGDTEELYKGKYRSYKPTYGNVVIRMTLKDYKTYVTLCSLRDKLSKEKHCEELYQKLKEYDHKIVLIIRKSIDKGESKFKGGDVEDYYAMRYNDLLR